LPKESGRARLGKSPTQSPAILPASRAEGNPFAPLRAAVRAEPAPAFGNLLDGQDDGRDNARKGERSMGRIVASVKIENVAHPDKAIRCDGLVDTGASHMVLPSAWRDRLGELDAVATVQLETATQKTVQGTICGPVRIQVEGFRPAYAEVLFVDMEPEQGDYEPLIGYLVLEQCQAAVDMLGHRLIHVKHLDLK
jgi:predicted aspartyl protease